MTTALREEICRVGNIRLPGGGFLITPTDAWLGTLDPARLAELDPEGRQIAGDRASKTLALHRRIYTTEAQAQCVIHTHATRLVALTLDACVERR